MEKDEKMKYDSGTVDQEAENEERKKDPTGRWSDEYLRINAYNVLLYDRKQISDLQWHSRRSGCNYCSLYQ